jgi:hypothetical protein
MEIYRKNDLKWFKVSKRGFREPQNCWFLVSVPEKLSSSSFWMVKTMSKLWQNLGNICRFASWSFNFCKTLAIFRAKAEGYLPAASGSHAEMLCDHWFGSVPQFLAELWNFTIWSFWDGDVGEWGWYSSAKPILFYTPLISSYLLVSYNYSQKT